MASEARKIVASVLGDRPTAMIWTGNYAPVIPFTPQGFSVGALMPMILYMFRWGHRRGRGKFNSTYAPPNGRPTIRSVTTKVIDDPRFGGFHSGIGASIMGDLLLTSSLENTRRREGHDEQIQRCFASHYMSSWIDLPFEAGNLRGVPDTLVAILSDQAEGEILNSSGTGRYPVGGRVSDNILLTLFARGISLKGNHESNVRSDQFDENEQLGLDQLVMVRLAQLCKEAPLKAAGKGEPGPIRNQRPIAQTSVRHLREDLVVFLDCFGRSEAIPRLTLLPMIETAFAIGLSTMILATVSVVEEWHERGVVPAPSEQKPWPLMVDCSGGADSEIRSLSELSMELARRQTSRLAAHLMHMRLLDVYVSNESEIDQNKRPPSTPDATAWLNLLGAIATGRHEESRDAERSFRKQTNLLVEAFRDDPAESWVADGLTEDLDGRTHASRLADVLSRALESSSGSDKINQYLSSAMMVDEPNGLARSRRVSQQINGRRASSVAYSTVLSNAALEYLVHRHLRLPGKGRKERGLSYPSFLNILRERYGFYVDQAAPNMEVASEVLQRNRHILERRLRDLGLLTGVNDAEGMKKLKARYRSAFEVEDEAALA
jgi:hypothetical protein